MVGDELLSLATGTRQWRYSGFTMSLLCIAIRVLFISLIVLSSQHHADVSFPNYQQFNNRVERLILIAASHSASLSTAGEGFCTASQASG
jgi:hypothetical protein